MTNCWIEDPKHRSTFTAIVQKIDPLLASLAGYYDFNETISEQNTVFLAPESEVDNEESSVNIEAVNDAPVANDAPVTNDIFVAISRNEEVACNNLSLSSGNEDHLNNETLEILSGDEELFKAIVSSPDDANEPFFTKTPVSDETSVTREAKVVDDIDRETYV